MVAARRERSGTAMSCALLGFACPCCPTLDQFVLRRSAGFAMSFQSVVRAEPTNAAPVLLPRTLQRLLYYAFDGAIPDTFAHVLQTSGVWSTLSWCR